MRFEDLTNADVAIWGYGREGRSVLAAIRRRFPQQALTLLNDPEFLEAARVLAQRLMSSGKGEDRDRINKAYQRVLSREVRDNECKSLIDFLATQREYYSAHADEARKLVRTGFAPAAADENERELAAWTSVCRVILNLHETITRY